METQHDEKSYAQCMYTLEKSLDTKQNTQKHIRFTNVLWKYWICTETQRIENTLFLKKNVQTKSANIWTHASIYNPSKMIMYSNIGCLQGDVRIAMMRYESSIQARKIAYGTLPEKIKKFLCCCRLLKRWFIVGKEKFQENCREMWFGHPLEKCLHN